jgi:hypothetical protein
MQIKAIKFYPHQAVGKVSQFLRLLLLAREAKVFGAKKRECFTVFFALETGTPVLLKYRRTSERKSVSAEIAKARHVICTEPPLICALCMCVWNYAGGAAAERRRVKMYQAVPSVLRPVCVHQQKPNFSHTQNSNFKPGAHCNLCPLAVSLARWVRKQFYMEILVCQSGDASLYKRGGKHTQPTKCKSGPVSCCLRRRVKISCLTSAFLTFSLPVKMRQVAT